MMNELHNGAINIRSSKLPGDLAPASAYFRWTDTAVGQLTGQIAERDIERLVLTPRYWALLGSPSVGTPQSLAVIDQEISQRVTAFDAACRELEAQIGRWTDQATYLVPDTSFICQGESLFDQADYHNIIGADWPRPIRVLIPIVVVNELDHLKEAGTVVRHRALVSLAILDRVIAGSPREPHELRPPELRQVPGQQGLAPTGVVTVEVLLDPPGHARLPRVDDEIIGRALAIEPLAGRRVTLLTCDTAQSFQARALGLNVVKAPRKNQAAQLAEAQKVEASKN